MGLALTRAETREYPSRMFTISSMSQAISSRVSVTIYAISGCARVWHVLSAEVVGAAHEITGTDSLQQDLDFNGYIASDQRHGS